jgi:hypothetical protein
MVPVKWHATWLPRVSESACICMYMHVSACICMYLHVSACICKLIHTNTSYTCKYIQIHTYQGHSLARVGHFFAQPGAYRTTLVCIWMYMYVFACISTYMHVYVCICMYLHVFHYQQKSAKYNWIPDLGVYLWLGRMSIVCIWYVFACIWQYMYVYVCICTYMQVFVWGLWLGCIVFFWVIDLGE